MKIKILVTGLTILFFLSSCKLLFKMTGGYKEPRYEKKDDIKKYANQFGGNYDGLYVCKDKYALKYIVDSVNQNIPYVLVTDKNLKSIYLDQKCPWSNLREVDSLMVKNTWKQDERFDFDRMIERLECIDGKSFSKKETSAFKYHIFYFWSKFVPRLSKAMIKEVSSFNDSKSNDVYIGAINLDFQEGWK